MHFTLNAERYNRGTDGSSRWKLLGERIGSADGAPREEPFQMLSSPPFGEERRSPSAALTTHAGHKFHEVFQLKQGSYTDLPAAKISEMMKSNSLDNAPTQSLLSVVNGILDESIELKNGKIPHRVACLLRKVVQEIDGAYVLRQNICERKIIFLGHVKRSTNQELKFSKPLVI
ncbi:hypothetical protein OROMI_009575 [Orobanche minor]